MSERTNIEWATSTGNPWIGCTKVSPGCKNCYAAELDANRFSKTMGGGQPGKPESHWGKGAPRVRTKAFWKDAVKWNREVGEALDSNIERSLTHMVYPHERPRIFPSLCDWLDDEVPVEWLADFLKLIHDTPNLDWLLLTKRPDNWKERMWAAMRVLDSRADVDIASWLSWWLDTGGKDIPPQNIWIGVSVEDKPRKNRLDLLRDIPAAVSFVSFEPLLEDLELTPADLKGIDWAIVGGESGNDRRNCGVDVICDVARQCVAAGVPCFTKQDCAFKPGQQGLIPADVWALKQFPT